MRWLDSGSGPVIIPLHGLLGGFADWTGLLEYFRRRYRVAIPLLPVYALPPEEATIDALVQFVHRFVEHLEVSNVNLIGSSLGGHIALLYALAHGERVRTLTLTGSSGLRENPVMGGSILRGGTPIRRDDYKLIESRAQTTFYDPRVATPQIVDDAYRLFNDDAKMASLVAMTKSAMRQKMDGELPLVTQPTCLIWGKNDLITPADVAEDFHRLLPHSELFWIDKCGHAPMLEHPDEFNGILSRWYERQGIDGAESRPSGLRGGRLTHSRQHHR